MTIKLIDHTADLGIEVTAAELPLLFQETAGAMCLLMVAPETLTPRATLELKLKGADWLELMMNWLRELLYLWHADKQLPAGIYIESLTPYRLVARVEVDWYDSARHSVEHDLKAVTWHQFGVQKVGEGWRCRVIFDV